MPLLPRSFDDLRELPGIFHLRRARYVRRFLYGTFGTQWGEFPTAEAARAAVPATKHKSYDEPSVVDINADYFARVHLFDWPVLFHLDRLIRDEGLRSLVDFGGHLGAKYFAFRSHLDLPDGFAWQVVETPAMANEGRRRAPRDATHLAFFERIEDAAPADILFCSGSIHYFDGTIGELITRMVRRPRVVILSRLPVCAEAGFYILDNLRTAKVPFRVFSAAENETLREAAGYERADGWDVGYRAFDLPYSRPRRHIRMIGEVWRDRLPTARTVAAPEPALATAD